MASHEGLIEETVRVTAIRGEWMTVEKLGGGAACTRCTQSCPSAYPHRIRRNSSTQWQTPIQPTARPGDVWRVGVDPAALLRGAGCVYVLPLAGLLTGAILGDGVAGDAGAALGGLTGLALFLFRLWISRPVSREISLVFIKKIHSA